MVIRALILTALGSVPAGTVSGVEWSLGITDAPKSTHRAKDFAFDDTEDEHHDEIPF